MLCCRAKSRLLLEDLQALCARSVMVASESAGRGKRRLESIQAAYTEEQ